MSRKKTPEQLVHGTYSTYNNHRCRCSLCTEAMRVYHREWAVRTGVSYETYQKPRYLAMKAKVAAYDKLMAAGLCVHCAKSVEDSTSRVNIKESYVTARGDAK